MIVDETVVIIGAGHAGATAATSLRESGWSGPIQLIGDETGEPYQRPPLSKGHLAGIEGEGDLVLRAHAALRRDDIEYLHGLEAMHVDRVSRVITLGSGQQLRYDRLILATGSRARRMAVVGSELRGIHTLRNRDDSVSLKASIADAKGFAVAGGGFLGLEAAAVAARAGKNVVVLERSHALLHRVVGRTIADRLTRLHRAEGVDVRFGVEIDAFRGESGAVREIDASDGRSLAADAVLVAIGGIPDTSLAERAGLEVSDGVVVDGDMRSSDERVFAIGDCARFPSAYTGSVIRMESVQNATDQARHVAGRLTGHLSTPYAAVPWFWSHQYDCNLQIAGLALPADDEIALEPTRAAGTAVVRHRDGRIVAVETLDDPKIHLKARRLLARGPVVIDRVIELAAPISPIPPLSQQRSYS